MLQTLSRPAKPPGAVDLVLDGFGKVTGCFHLGSRSRGGRSTRAGKLISPLIKENREDGISVNLDDALHAIVI